ncbi:MAG: hypothetical protein NTY88_06575 [Bacteroidetes bacterium]|nr:hypothetical protein [Bacteroidota bacterium]
MIDLILVALFCYQINRMAHERGLASMPFVLNYLAIFFLAMIAFVSLLISYMGKNVLQTPEGIKAAMMFEPFAIMFEIFLFIYFRKKIQRAKVFNGNEDDFTPPPSSPNNKPKKDLSYFR